MEDGMRSAIFRVSDFYYAICDDPHALQRQRQMTTVEVDELVDP
jgi:hypothetical protein